MVTAAPAGATQSLALRELSEAEKFRNDVRAAAELTCDDWLLAIAEVAEAPVWLDNCRQLDPDTRIAMFCRLGVSPAEMPRWRPIPPGGVPATSRSEIDGFLRTGRIEEHALPDGRFWHRVGPAGDLPGICAAIKVTPATDSTRDSTTRRG